MQQAWQKLGNFVGHNLFAKRDAQNLLYYDFLKNTAIIVCFNLLTLALSLLIYYSFYHEIDFVINDLQNEQDLTVHFDPNEWSNLSGISNGDRLIRSWFAYILIWYLFFVLWTIRIGIIYHRSNVGKLYSWLWLLSFWYITNVFLFFYNCKFANRFIIRKSWDNFWQQDSYLKTHFYYFSRKWFLLLFVWLLFIPTLLFVFYQQDHELITNPNWMDTIFFSSFWFFTYQSNLLCLLFLSLHLLFPTNKLFQTNLFHMVTVTQISLTGVVWNSILLPFFIQTGNTQTWTNYDFFSTIWLHIIAPASFVIFTFFWWHKTNDRPYLVSYAKNMFYSMCYPCMYGLFAGLLPFLSGVSVYGWATNLNSNLAVFDNYATLETTFSFGSWFYLFSYFGIYGMTFLIASIYHLINTIQSAKNNNVFLVNKLKILTRNVLDLFK